MGCLIAILGAVFPRFMIVVLYFFTDWFNGLFDSMLWPVLGFFFAPFTLLWYTVVINYWEGDWGTIAIIGMVIAIAADFGGTDSARRKRKDW